MTKSCKNIVDKLLIILEYLMALMIILSTRSVFEYVNIKLHLNISIVIVLLLYLIIYFCFKKNYKELINIVKKYYKYFGIYLIFVGIFGIFSINVTLRFFLTYIILIPLFILYYITKKDSKYDILKKICDLVLIIALISLFFYVIVSLFHLIKPTHTPFYYWGPKRNVNGYYYLYYETQTYYGRFFTIARNTSIFTEAPMYSLILTMSLISELFLIKRNKKINLIVYTITILTTFCVTGIIIMILSYFLKIISIYFKKFKRKKISKKFKIIFISLIIFMGIIGMYFVYDRFSTNSPTIRVEDITSCIKAWINNPIFGVGFQNHASVKVYYSLYRLDNYGISSSFFQILAECGIYLLIFYMFPFVYFIIKSIKKKNYDIISYEIIMFLLFVMATFAYTLSSYNLLALAYAQILIDNPLKKSRRKL